MNLLETKRLAAFYGDFQALYGMDVRLDKGETLAVIGANGAGKTTLLRTLCGMIPAQEAQQVYFQGKPVGRLPTHELTAMGIAMIPEGRKLFPSLNVEENLLMGAYVRRPGPWTLEAVYRMFPVLETFRARPATLLSGGQQQMVAIGRALMSNPAVLLCDEISLGLAPVIVKEVYKAIPTIRDQGVSLILVEQDIHQALAVSNRMICLCEGRIVLEGPADAYTQDQIANAYFGVKKP